VDYGLLNILSFIPAFIYGDTGQLFGQKFIIFGKNVLRNTDILRKDPISTLGPEL
jgi:hypothetical protein